MLHARSAYTSRNWNGLSTFKRQVLFASTLIVSLVISTSEFCEEKSRLVRIRRFLASLEMTVRKRAVIV